MSDSKKSWWDRFNTFSSIFYLSMLIAFVFLALFLPDITEYYKIKNAPAPKHRFENYEACLASKPLIDEDGMIVRKNIKSFVLERFETIEDYCRDSKYIVYKNK